MISTQPTRKFLCFHRVTGVPEKEAPPPIKNDLAYKNNENVITKVMFLNLQDQLCISTSYNREKCLSKNSFLRFKQNLRWSVSTRNSPMLHIIVIWVEMGKHTKP